MKKNKKLIILISSITAAILLIVLSTVLIINLTKDTYIVTFNSNGGTNINSVEVKHGKKITEPNSPKKEDVIFYEWQLEGETFNFNTKIKKDLTLDAVYNEFYTVKFDTNGSNLTLEDQRIEHGKTVEMPTVTPTKSHFNFNRWEVNGVEFTSSSVVLSDITIKASFNYDVRSVRTFIDLFSGGLVQAKITIDYNSEADPIHEYSTGTLNFNQLLLKTEDRKNGADIQTNYIELSNNNTMFVNIDEGWYNFSQEETSLIPLYNLELTLSDFSESNGVYSYENIFVSYISNNKFQIVQDYKTYTIELQENPDLDYNIVYYGTKYYLITNNEAILLGITSGTYDAIILDENITFNNINYPLTQIGDNVFKDKVLKSFKSNTKLEVIGRNAFSGAKVADFDMKSKVIHTYGDSAFLESDIFREFIIPTNTKYIGESLFQGCINLSYIYTYLEDTDQLFANATNWRVGQNVIFSWDGIKVT